MDSVWDSTCFMVDFNIGGDFMNITNNNIIGALVAVIACLLIMNFVFGEPPPRCCVYTNTWRNCSYDIPCDQIESWCEEHGCEHAYGNCGRPECFCGVKP